MDFSLTEAQQEIREAILKLCAGFGDDYWLGRDRDGVSPPPSTAPSPMAAGSASRCRKPMAAAASASRKPPS